MYKRNYIFSKTLRTMRDLPLNEQQRKEGCIFLSVLLILFIIGLAMLHYAVNDSITGVIEFVAGFVITLAILYFIDKYLIK
jgi:hypothetical protein